MKGKKFWLVIGIIVGLALIGLIVMVISGKWGKITADAAELWSLQPDSGITAEISDGVEEAQAGDLLNYKIDVAYQGEAITTQEELDKALDGLIKRFNLRTSRSNVKLTVVGYLATGKVMITDSVIADQNLKVYNLPGQVGTLSWLLRYPNFEMVINQLKANSSISLNIPATVPSYVPFYGGKIRGGVYVYLSGENSFRPILVARAVDEDKYIPSTIVTPQPTPLPGSSIFPLPLPTPSASPTAEITSLQISPLSPGFVLGGQQIAFTCIANFSDGSKKEVTRSNQTSWQAITTSPGSQLKEIGAISSAGIFKAANYITAGIMRVDSTPAKGKIVVEYNGKKAETNEFSVLPISHEIGF